MRNEEHSDGYYFEDWKTHRLIDVSGSCIVDHGGECPATRVAP